MTRCYREAIARGLFWAGGVLGSGVRGFVLLPGKSRIFSRVKARFFFFQGRMFFSFEDRAGSGLFPGQGQSKIVKVFLSEVRQSKVVKILLFRARSRQGQGKV